MYKNTDFNTYLWSNNYYYEFNIYKKYETLNGSEYSLLTPLNIAGSNKIFLHEKNISLISSEKK